MKLLPLFLGILLGIWLVSLLGCSSGTTTTTSTNPMGEIARKVEQDQGRRLYRYIQDGKGQETEEQWSWVEEGSKPNQFRYTEVYNTFQIDDQTTEYYVQQFSLTGTDTTNRFVIKDFQFIAAEDSFTLTQSDTYGGKVVEKTIEEIEGREIEVYKILGYAHIGDPEPGHHKYWSPEIGTVLIWYGEERFLELIQPSYPFVQALKDTIIRTLQTDT